jgi:hypothetical protein
LFSLLLAFGLGWLGAGNSLHAEPSPAADIATADQASLGSAIDLLKICRDRMKSVFDYRCRVIRESARSPGETTIEEVLAKYRQQPTSVYWRWTAPVDGQEIIWVEGLHGGRLLSHGTRPANDDGPDARRGSLVSAGLPTRSDEVLQVGLAGLVDRLFVRWSYEEKLGLNPAVSISRVKVNARRCYLVSVVYPLPDDGRIRFHTTRAYIDTEHLVMTRLEEFGYPDRPGLDPGRLLEAVTILDLHLNPGLSDLDFSISNPEYGFARF